MTVYYLKRLSDNQLTAVAAPPKWDNGMWLCGDQKILDPQGNLFEAVPSYELLSPVTFHDSFSVSERIKIKSSTDPIVQEFWKTFELAASQPGAMIDPNGAVIIGGLAYIAGQTQSPQPVIAAGDLVLASPARIAQILAGTPGGF